MHLALRRIRYCPVSSRLSNPSPNVGVAGSVGSLTGLLPHTALVFPSVTPGSPISRLSRSKARQYTTKQPWSEASSNESTHPSKSLEWNKDGGLGQGESYLHAPERLLRKEFVTSETAARYSSQHESLALRSEENRLASSGKFDIQNNKAEEAWSYFLDLHRREDYSSLIGTESEILRNSILRAALTDPTRMFVLYSVARHLRTQLQFEWPELYVRVVHFYLGHANYEIAYLWHVRLMSTFTPTLDEFQALLASFTVDPTRELQDVLKKIYILSPLRKVYDHLIPTLFEYGQSQTARAWRKLLVLYGDFPSSPKSEPFLNFCIRYYPLQPLSKKELAIANRNWSSSTGSNAPSNSGTKSDIPKGIYSDSFIARWFASSWTSVEFAIDLMHKLGLRTIGPRSLQSLALREDNVDDVANRIAQLERLGITISPTIYCRALITFAKERQQELLTELLSCDVHPDEFEDKDTRRMLITAAKRHHSENQERLLHEVESIALGRSEMVAQSPLQDLNQLLEIALTNRNMVRARLLLDKMDSENIDLSNRAAAKLLDYVFDSLWYFPKKVKQKVYGKSMDPQLDRAIHIIRRVAQHDVAISLKYWRIILYNLGRLERFEELEELSHEIVDLYTSTPRGLLPVHKDDLPPEPAPRAKRESLKTKAVDREADDDFQVAGIWPELDEFWGNDVKVENPTDSAEQPRPKQKSKRKQRRYMRPDAVYHIPSDLPLSNQQHPTAKLFDKSLQRAVVRWGFDTKLASPPIRQGFMELTTPKSADFDIAWGVRFLATLRDRGLHIDTQVLKSALISRISIAQIPGRNRHRSRDEHELSPATLKALIDAAWGTELLPTLPRFVKQLEDRKPTVWNRYPRLLGKAYDTEETTNEPKARRLGT